MKLAENADSNVPQIPDLLGPILSALKALGVSGRPSEVVDHVARDLALTERTLNEQTGSGVFLIANRVAWARFYHFRAGLISSSKQGVSSSTIATSEDA